MWLPMFREANILLARIRKGGTGHNDVVAGLKPTATSSDSAAISTSIA